LFADVVWQAGDFSDAAHILLPFSFPPAWENRAGGGTKAVQWVGKVPKSKFQVPHIAIMRKIQGVERGSKRRFRR
jgi:hypothetical protein